MGIGVWGEQFLSEAWDTNKMAHPLHNLQARSIYVRGGSKHFRI